MQMRALRWVLMLLLAGCSAAPMHPPAPSRAGGEGAGARAPEAASGFEARPGVLADRHMVASANPLASEAGLRTLRAGGSAVDAAIAVQMVLTLVEPQSSGIGGGLFLVHHDGRRVQTFDGRETAPAEATPDLFLSGGKPMPFARAVVGGLAVGTPGVLRALELAHAQHGRLPWRELFQPAIALAEAGFVVSPRLATLLRSESARFLRQDPRASALFFSPDGVPLSAGQRLRNPELAATLRSVAERGSVALHEGEIARDIVAAVRGHPTNPGRLSEADLSRYRAVPREPLCFDYRTRRICGMPPPSSGTLAVAQMLGMLSGRDLSGLAPLAAPWGREPNVQAVHLFSEAGRLAYADRARYVADPDFVALPGGDASALLSDRYLQSRAVRIGERSMGRAEPGVPLPNAVTQADDRSPELPSTSHVSVVDGFGNSLSMTTTIENAFGAQIMVRGFLLNNQLTDFSFVPEENGVPVANRVQPAKRPRSSMTPLLVFDRDSGAVVMSVGSPGGSAIINYVAKVLVSTLDWQMDLQEAIGLPNFGSRNGPTELERGRASPGLIEALAARGHEVTVIEQTSGLQGIARVKRDGRDRWFGAADPRREGVALGD
jgi:gamma-glutamyltranspeptidase / glutathione hydrolase